MLIENVGTSWAGFKSMSGFPLLPKRLITQTARMQGRTDITEVRWFRRVRWARISIPVDMLASDIETGQNIWKDSHWLD